jgi:hypothetical protein
LYFAQADSEWRLYFDFLPRDFQTPLQWSTAELQLLQVTTSTLLQPIFSFISHILTAVQGTPLHERVVFERESLRQFYEQVHPDIHPAFAFMLHLSLARRSCFPRSATLIPFTTPRLSAHGVFFSG